MPPRARPSKPAKPTVARGPSGPWKLRLLLAAVALISYANSFTLGFALDGNLIVQQDPRIREATAENIGHILDKPYYWPSQADVLYRPVTTFSFLVNYALLGNATRAGGYHWLNFLLHLLNAFLCFALARRLFGRDLPAFFAAALWAAHPIGVEAVTNVAGRADLLAAAAVLGSLVLYIRAADAQGWRRYAAVALLFALALAGLLSKENAAILTGAMLAWDFFFTERSRATILRRLPFYAAASLPLAIWFLIRREIFNAAPLPPVNVVDNPLLGLGFLASRWMALKILGLDLWLLIFPVGLSADRSYNQIPYLGVADALAWLAMAALGAVAAALILKQRGNRAAMWSAAFFAMALIPTSNLLLRIGSCIAERFLYLPAVGFAAALVAVVWQWKPERSVAIGLSILLALYAVRTLARNPAWADNAALAAADVQTATHSFRLHDMHGQSLYSKDPQHNLDAAIVQLETARDILRPLPPAQRFSPTPAILGTYYGIKGDLAGGVDTADGRAWYEKARAALTAARDETEAFQASYDDLQRRHGRPLPPIVAYAPAFFYLGQVYQRLGNYADAVRYYRQGTNLQPGNPIGYDTLAKAYFDHGDYDDAAVAVMTKVLLVGVEDPNVTNGMHEIYSKLADGACAFPESSAGLINLECARVHSDLCKASVALSDAFIAGRQPDKARESRLRAASQYSCPMPAK